MHRALAKADMDQFLNGLPEGLDTLVGENGSDLSGDERRLRPSTWCHQVVRLEGDTVELERAHAAA